MRLFGIISKICNNRSWKFLLAVVVLTTSLHAQQRRPGAQPKQPDRDALVKKEAAKIKKDANMLLNDWVVRNIQISKDDLKALDKSVSHSRKFSGRFSKQEKALLYMLQAYIAHYGDESSDQVFRHIDRALRTNPKNRDIIDSLVLFSMIYDKYDKIEKIYKTQKAGQAALLMDNVSESFNSKQLSRAESKFGLSGQRDPNSQDPNSQSGASSKKSSSVSKFSRNLDSNKKSKKTTKSSYRQRTIERNKKRTAKNNNQRRSAAGTGPLSGGILNLAYEYMPYELLGKSFSTMNMRNVNGSFFHYDTNQGQILCALLWSMPPEQGASKMSKRSASSIISNEFMDVPDIAFDLWTNVDEFTDLYSFYLKTGKVQFASANVDRFNYDHYLRMNRVLVDNPWPWPNFNIEDEFNKSQWQFTDKYSPIMLIADPKGKIRYAGPVGGFLPLALIDSLLPQAKVSKFNLLKSGNEQSSKSQIEHFKKMTQQLVNTINGGTGQVMPVVNMTSSEQVDFKKTETESENGNLQSNPQAFSLLQQAKIKKKYSMRSAVNTYDEILQRYPDSQEAAIAKLRIKEICQLDSYIRKERTGNGKFTGL